MQKLEERVRDAIVERKITTIGARFQEPRYQQRYHKMFANVAEEVYTRFAGTEYGKVRLTVDEVREFTTPLLTPQKIRAAIEIVVKDSYTLSQELEKELQEIEPQIYNLIRSKLQGLRANVHSQTRIVRELTRIAEKNAGTQEAEDIAVQTVFPTVQEYRNFVNQSYEIREEISGAIKELEIQRKAKELSGRVNEQMSLYLATITCLTIRNLYTLIRQVDKESAFERISTLYGN